MGNQEYVLKRFGTSVMYPDAASPHKVGMKIFHFKVIDCATELVSRFLPVDFIVSKSFCQGNRI
jgi:hypothetical protein